MTTTSATRRAALAPKPHRRPSLAERIERMEKLATDPNAKAHHVEHAQRLIDSLTLELERRRLCDGVSIAILTE